MISFKRHFNLDYVLTDTFLLQAHNPYAPKINEITNQKVEEYKVLAR